MDALLKIRDQTGLFLLAIVVSLIATIPSAAGPSRSADWPMWGYDLSNHRYNGNETTITPANIGQLKLRWVYAFPNTGITASQPVVIGDTVYVGSWNGNVYALNVETGEERWTFSTGITGQRGSIRVGAAMTKAIVLVGDQMGRFFALSKANGQMVWLPRDLGGHPLAQITGSPIVYGDRVYVPMASREENAASDPKYPCCTFRGSLTALNIADGSTAWRLYTVDPLMPRGTSSTGAQLSGPSGAGIWSTPAIDPDEGLIYVSTGNSYSPPASPYSDAILAINLKDGTLRWATQLTQGDWANSACIGTPGPNCEGTPGKDVDFGFAPLLFTAQTAQGPRKLVTAVQKSGAMYALDALTGKLVWEQRVGTPTSYAWGGSYDGKRLYVADTSYDSNGGVYALDPATGGVLWHIGPLSCVPGPGQPADACWSGYMAAAVSTPGLVWLGAMDGQVRALDSSNGSVLWTYDTAQQVIGVNGIQGHGGSVGPANVTVANGQVYVMSGYTKWNERILDGNVLFVFGLEGQKPF